MNSRMDFRIPEFLRVAWASQLAREYWEPKVHAIANVWPSVERASIIHGLRYGALQSVSPEDLPDVQNWALANEISFSIVGMDGAYSDYGNASVPYTQGNHSRIAYTLEETRKAFSKVGSPTITRQ